MMKNILDRWPTLALIVVLIAASAGLGRWLMSSMRSDVRTVFSTGKSLGKDETGIETNVYHISASHPVFNIPWLANADLPKFATNVAVILRDTAAHASLFDPSRLNEERNQLIALTNRINEAFKSADALANNPIIIKSQLGFQTPNNARIHLKHAYAMLTALQAVVEYETDTNPPKNQSESWNEYCAMIQAGVLRDPIVKFMSPFPAKLSDLISSRSETISNIKEAEGLVTDNYDYDDSGLELVMKVSGDSNLPLVLREQAKQVYEQKMPLCKKEDNLWTLNGLTEEGKRIAKIKDVYPSLALFHSNRIVFFSNLCGVLQTATNDMTFQFKEIRELHPLNSRNLIEQTAINDLDRFANQWEKALNSEKSQDNNNQDELVALRQSWENAATNSSFQEFRRVAQSRHKRYDDLDAVFNDKGNPWLAFERLHENQYTNAPLAWRLLFHNLRHGFVPLEGPNSAFLLSEQLQSQAQELNDKEETQWAERMSRFLCWRASWLDTNRIEGLINQKFDIHEAAGLKHTQASNMVSAAETAQVSMINLKNSQEKMAQGARMLNRAVVLEEGTNIGWAYDETLSYLTSYRPLHDWMDNRRKSWKELADAFDKGEDASLRSYYVSPRDPEYDTLQREIACAGIYFIAKVSSTNNLQDQSNLWHVLAESAKTNGYNELATRIEQGAQDLERCQQLAVTNSIVGFSAAQSPAAGTRDNPSLAGLKSELRGIQRMARDALESETVLQNTANTTDTLTNQVAALTASYQLLSEGAKAWPTISALVESRWTKWKDVINLGLSNNQTGLEAIVRRQGMETFEQPDPIRAYAATILWETEGLTLKETSNSRADAARNLSAVVRTIGNNRIEDRYKRLADLIESLMSAHESKSLEDFIKAEINVAPDGAGDSIGTTRQRIIAAQAVARDVIDTEARLGVEASSGDLNGKAGHIANELKQKLEGLNESMAGLGSIARHATERQNLWQRTFDANEPEQPGALEAILTADNLQTVKSYAGVLLLKREQLSLGKIDEKIPAIEERIKTMSKSGLITLADRYSQFLSSIKALKILRDDAQGNSWLQKEIRDDPSELAPQKWQDAISESGLRKGIQSNDTNQWVIFVRQLEFLKSYKLENIDGWNKLRQSSNPSTINGWLAGDQWTSLVTEYETWKKRNISFECFKSIGKRLNDEIIALKQAMDAENNGKWEDAKRYYESVVPMTATGAAFRKARLYRMRYLTTKNTYTLPAKVEFAQNKQFKRGSFRKTASCGFGDGVTQNKSISNAEWKWPSDWSSFYVHDASIQITQPISFLWQAGDDLVFRAYAEVYSPTYEWGNNLMCEVPFSGNDGLKKLAEKVNKTVSDLSFPVDWPRNTIVIKPDPFPGGLTLESVENWVDTTFQKKASDLGL